MIVTFLKDALEIFRRAVPEFGEDDPITMAGALAFFTVLAIPPVLLIIITLVGLLTGEDFASKELYGQIQLLWGEEPAEMIEEIVRDYSLLGENVLQSVFGVIVFILASTTFFAVMQNALNRIWRVRPDPDVGILKVLKDRAISFGLILLLVVILMASLGIDSAVLFLKDQFSILFPGISPVLFGLIGYLVSFFLIMLVLAAIYKFLPDVRIGWNVVWIGAAFTSLLFNVGKLIIGFALSSSNINELYGGAGSIIIILLWVFYTSIILYYGAEVTRQYAEFTGRNVQPREHAVRIETREVES